MARLATANDIITRAAAEVGLKKVTDPLSSTDDNFIQLAELLNGVGQELVELHPWQTLSMPFQLTTQLGDTGTYDLPDDYSYMVDQTGWERTNRVPIGGPLSAQDWAYLDGRNLVSQSIYASFRIDQNSFQLYPQPPPVGLDVNFEYISRNWIRTQADVRHDLIQSGSDFVLYEPIVAIKFLKAKWLEAKGFDASSARLEFENMFNSRTGKDEGAPILSASSRGAAFPYISPYVNTPDTGYGL